MRILLGTSSAAFTSIKLSLLTTFSPDLQPALRQICTSWCELATPHSTSALGQAFAEHTRAMTDAHDDLISQFAKTSLNTADITLLSHTHGRERRAERSIDKLELQAAVKYGASLRAQRSFPCTHVSVASLSFSLFGLERSSSGNSYKPLSVCLLRGPRKV